MCSCWYLISSSLQSNTVQDFIFLNHDALGWHKTTCQQIPADSGSSPGRIPSRRYLTLYSLFSVSVSLCSFCTSFVFWMYYFHMLPEGRIRENGSRMFWVGASTPEVFWPLRRSRWERDGYAVRPPGYFCSAPHGSLYSFVLAGVSKHKHVVVIEARKFAVLIMGSQDKQTPKSNEKNQPCI